MTILRGRVNHFTVPCLPTISATCSELGTGTHSVMLALFLPPAVIAAALTSDRRLPTAPPAVVATMEARLSTGDAFPPPPLDDDDDSNVGIAPLEAVAADVEASTAAPRLRLDANLARSSASWCAAVGGWKAALGRAPGVEWRIAAADASRSPQKTSAAIGSAGLAACWPFVAACCCVGARSIRTFAGIGCSCTHASCRAVFLNRLLTVNAAANNIWVDRHYTTARTAQIITAHLTTSYLSHLQALICHC